MDIFISGLPLNMNSENLVHLFAIYGRVIDSTIIKDQTTRKSIGRGLVKMPNEKEAKRAIDSLNGQVLDGTRISVKEHIARAKR